MGHQKLEFISNGPNIKVLWNKQLMGTIDPVTFHAQTTTGVTSNFNSLSEAIQFFYSFNWKTYHGNTHKRPGVRFSNAPKLTKKRFAIDGYPNQDFTDPHKYAHVAANTHFIKREGEN